MGLALEEYDFRLSCRNFLSQDRSIWNGLNFKDTRKKVFHLNKVEYPDIMLRFPGATSLSFILEFGIF